jgi:uncharacterized protein
MMRLRISLLVVLAVSLAGCLDLDGFLANERELEEYTLPGNTIPSHLIEPVTLRSGGHTLHGFWVGSNGARPGLTVLYCHGNKHHLDAYWDRVMYLHDLGVNVFIFDYRGFGRSEGTFSEEGLFEDARTALRHVLARPGVTADSLVVYGFSLGNVASIYLAAEAVDPLLLVAEAPFASAASLTQGALGFGLPGGWLTAGRFDNADRVRGVRAPLLLLHGDADDFVRYRDNGRVVYERAPGEKRLVLVPGAGHSDIPETMGLPAYHRALREAFRAAAAL